METQKGFKVSEKLMLRNCSFGRIRDEMKYLVWIMLVIGFFGCKNKQAEKSPLSSLSSLKVDSIQIFYTTEWLTNKVIDTLTAADSAKKQFFLINRPSHSFDEIAYIQTKLPNNLTIKDSILITKLKDCFAYRTDSNKGMVVGDCGLPIYRDIIILYANEKKIAQIKVCFQCNYISIYPEEINKYVNINDTTISRLENYFNRNVHKLKML